MSRLRYRLARRLVGRFVTLPEPQGDHPIVVLVFPRSATGGEASIVMQPKAFRMKSRITMASFDNSETMNLTPGCTRTTFVGVVER